MFAILGVFIVLGCVIGGYILEGGPLGVLMQPIELLIIGGAAIGAFFIASPKSVIFGTIKKSFKVFTASEASKQTFLDILSVIYTLMNMARRDGIVSIESHVNKPDGSAVFTRYPSVLKNHEVRDFICDNFKVLLAGNIEPHQFESLMDIDMSASHKHESNTPNAINKVADSLPGWASWPQSSASCSPWARSTSRRKSLATASARPWSAHFLASSCATALPVPWPRTWSTR